MTNVATFIDAATTILYVESMPGFPIPIQMPSGIQAGDKLVAFIENSQINPVSIVGPSGWTGTLSTGFFTKTADGSENGAVLNWTTQDTTETFNNTLHRVITAAVMCYRFAVPTLAPPNAEFRFFQGASGGTSATLTDIPQGGLVASHQLRVYCAFGQRADGPFDTALVHPITGVSWTNPTVRVPLISEEWANDGSFLNDSTGLSVADIEYDFPPPFAVYNPHDAVTVFGGADSTGFDLYTAVYNFPFVETVAYWGINASTPF